MELKEKVERAEGKNQAADGGGPFAKIGNLTDPYGVGGEAD